MPDGPCPPEGPADRNLSTSEDRSSVKPRGRAVREHVRGYIRKGWVFALLFLPVVIVLVPTPCRYYGLYYDSKFFKLPGLYPRLS